MNFMLRFLLLIPSFAFGSTYNVVNCSLVRMGHDWQVGIVISKKNFSLNIGQTLQFGSMSDGNSSAYCNLVTGTASGNMLVVSLLTASADSGINVDGQCNFDGMQVVVTPNQKTLGLKDHVSSDLTIASQDTKDVVYLADPSETGSANWADLACHRIATQMNAIATAAGRAAHGIAQ